MDQVIYVSGKFSDDNKARMYENIKLAYKTTTELIKSGFSVVCPHTMGVLPDKDELFIYDSEIDYNTWLDNYVEIMKRCDGVLMLPNWTDSFGARYERDVALMYGIPVFYSIEEILDYFQE